MKRKNYVNETIHIKKDIVEFMFIIISLVVIAQTLEQYHNKDFSTGIFILVIIVILILLSFLCYDFIKDIVTAIKTTKTADKIIEEGQKVPGKIIDIIEEKEVYHDDEGTRVIRSYYVKVEYELNDKKITIKSPKLEFHPNYLLDNNVDVYLYQEKYYIDNYKIDEAKIKETITSERKKNVKIILAFFIFVIISALLFFLSIIKNLNMHLTFVLFAILGFIYLILAIQISNKK